MLLKPSLSLVDWQEMSVNRYLEHLAKTPARGKRDVSLGKWLQISWVRPTKPGHPPRQFDHGYKLSIIMPRNVLIKEGFLADALGPEVPWDAMAHVKEITAQRGRIFATVTYVEGQFVSALSAAITKRKLIEEVLWEAFYVVPFRSCLNAPKMLSVDFIAAEKEALLLAAELQFRQRSVLLPFSAILGSFILLRLRKLLCKHGPKRNIKMHRT
ncbi:hypothetical protein SPFM12_00201 [Salmonella phage SPFM12]|nr:hypothetical protein SPFM12_00201 [Salmonella phage SPFM12]